jgi:CRISPR-associated protein (TIGR02710 family)
MTPKDQAADRIRAATPEEAQRLYDEEYFPLALAEMRKQGSEADVLVATAGSQPYSVALSLSHTRAKVVVLLHTAESLVMARRAVALAGVPPETVVFREVHRENPSDVYREIGSVARQHPGEKVVVDFTSGTKPMVAGASTAAGFFKFEQVYVASETLRSTPHLQYRERAVVVEHPLLVFGDETRETAEREFDAGRFDVAARGFEELKQALVPGYHHDARLALCGAYGAWTMLQFGRAQAELAKSAELLARAKRQHLASEVLLGVRERLVGQARVAAVLVRALEERARPARDPELAYVLLRFLLAEAHRRSATDLSLAALLLTRALELGFQRALARHGLDANDPRYEQLTTAPEALLERFNEQAGRHAVKSLPPKLALAQCRTLLLALGDESARGGMSPMEFNGLLKLRNESIYAHGTSPVTRKALDELRKGVRKLLTSLAEPDGTVIPWPRDADDHAYDPELCLVRFGSLRG